MTAIKVTKLTVSRSEKFSLPGKYESTGTELSLEIELQPGQAPGDALPAAKAELDRLFWWAAQLNWVEAVQRASVGTPAYFAAKQKGT